MDQTQGQRTFVNKLVWLHQGQSQSLGLVVVCESGHIKALGHLKVSGTE